MCDTEVFFLAHSVVPLHVVLQTLTGNMLNRASMLSTAPLGIRLPEASPETFPGHRLLVHNAKPASLPTNASA